MFFEFFGASTKNIEAVYLFSTSHVVAIFTIIAFTVIISQLFRKPQLEKYRVIFRYTFFFVFLVEEILYKIWRIAIFHSPIRENLSLNLCAITIILLMIVLINKNERLFELTYFWGLAGATQAILTPDIGQYGFPHFRFFQFFLSHGSIVAVVVFLTVVEGLKPKKGSIKRVFIMTNAYALVIFLVNYILGTNYLFISRKPVTASALDLLGPWPWYILSLEGIALVLFVIMYSPFIISKFVQKKDDNITHSIEQYNQ